MDTNRTPKKVIRNRKVAVLVSPGFGAGWSSWNTGPLEEFLLFDERLVLAKEAGHDEADIEALMGAWFGDDQPYIGGWDQVVIEWVPVGTQFRIDEYDGSETLRTLGNTPYFTA